MACSECAKRREQFNNQGVIVERNIKEKAASVVNAAADFFTKKTVKSDDKTYKQRLSRCSNCDYLKRKQNLPKGVDLSIKDTCLICGCYLKAKASQIGESFECPLLWWEFENETDFQAAFDEYQEKKNEKDYNKILAFIDEKTIAIVNKADNSLFNVLINGIEKPIIRVEYNGGASRQDLIEFCEKADIDFYYIGFYLSEMLNNQLIRLSFDNERKIDTFILIQSEEKD